MIYRALCLPFNLASKNLSLSSMMNHLFMPLSTQLQFGNYFLLHICDYSYKFKLHIILKVTVNGTDYS